MRNCRRGDRASVSIDRPAFAGHAMPTEQSRRRSVYSEETLLPNSVLYFAPVPPAVG